MAIAYATKNIVQIHIMKSLYDLLFYGIQENLQHLYTEPINLEKVLPRAYPTFSMPFVSAIRMKPTPQ